MASKVKLAGKVVAITGGARGIGRALAAAFVHEGAMVMIGDVDKELCERTAEELGGGCVGLLLDVTDLSSWDTFLANGTQVHGEIDVMVNNAGIMPVTPFVDESAESIQRQLDINVRGVIWGSQLAARRMRGRGGTIVNIASGAGKFGSPGLATYCATKHAVVGLSDSLSMELYSENIAVVCVMPGLVNTELTSGVGEHWLLKTVQPEDIATAAVRAVKKGRFPVMVPKRLNPIVKVFGLLPRPAVVPAMKTLGLDHFMLDAHNSRGRAAYEARIIQGSSDTAESSRSLDC